jgi:hypothetical protein
VRDGAKSVKAAVEDAMFEARSERALRDKMSEAEGRDMPMRTGALILA